MTKDEFREFCHKTFVAHGFHRKGYSNYYLNGEKRMLCSIDLQKSMADGYYLNFCYYEGEFNKIKDYPPPYLQHFVFYSRIIVPQQNPGMANISGTITTNAISTALGDGLMTRKAAMTDLRENSDVTGIGASITDEDIENAEDEAPPGIGELGDKPPESPGGDPISNEPTADSAGGRGYRKWALRWFKR